LVEAAQAVTEAVEALYREFAGYPLRPVTYHCDCCVGEADELEIRSAPLRDLTPEQLQGFAASSLMTWGDLIDVKHFLPRLFEIAANEGYPNDYPDLETLVGLLDRGDWRTWPDGEQAAVERFLGAWWDQELTAVPAVHSADTVLCAIATSLDDLTVLLDAWAAASARRPAALRYAAMVCWEAEELGRGVPLSNPWLDRRPVQEQQIRTWLIGSKSRFRPHLEALLDVEETDEEDAAVVVKALAVLAEL
jgi:hypothetical protein